MRKQNEEKGICIYICVYVCVYTYMYIIMAKKKKWGKWMCWNMEDDE